MGMSATEEFAAHRFGRIADARDRVLDNDAQAALDMGLVNTVVPLEALEEETVRWCRRMLEHSPLALRMLKAYVQASAGNNADLQQAFKRIELQVAPAVQASGTAADPQSAALDPQPNAEGDSRCTWSSASFRRCRTSRRPPSAPRPGSGRS